MTPLLCDDKITLRAVEATDLDNILAWENDTTIWEVGSSMAPFSRKSIWDYIESYNPDIFAARQLRLIIECNDSRQAVGMIDLYDFDPMNRRAGVGLLIDRAYRHQGYGLRSLALLAGYAGKFIGMHQLWAVVSVDNSHSVDLFKKSGYRITGRMKSWLRSGKSYRDAFMMQLLIN